MTSQCCVWDITIPADKAVLEDLKKWMKTNCKSYAFQLERGSETGYVHYQCRISLKEKDRLSGVKRLLAIEEAHLCPTSDANKANMFYVMKEDTKIDGPWTDKDEEPLYIPRQIRDITALRPWQQSLISDKDVWNTRSINILIDKMGNIGKSILKTWIGVHQIGRSLPFSNDYKDFMRMVMDTPKRKLYIIDVPRAIRKEQVHSFFSGIETLKDGYAYDDRYKFREEYFDCPNIWVFMNTLPDRRYMSFDRWNLWEVIENNLVPKDWPEIEVLPALASLPVTLGKTSDSV